MSNATLIKYEPKSVLSFLIRCNRTEKEFKKLMQTIASTFRSDHAADIITAAHCAAIGIGDQHVADKRLHSVQYCVVSPHGMLHECVDLFYTNRSILRCVEVAITLPYIDTLPTRFKSVMCLCDKKCYKKNVRHNLNVPVRMLVSDGVVDLDPSWVEMLGGEEFVKSEFVLRRSSNGYHFIKHNDLFDENISLNTTVADLPQTDDNKLYDSMVGTIENWNTDYAYVHFTRNYAMNGPAK